MIFCNFESSPIKFVLYFCYKVGSACKICAVDIVSLNEPFQYKIWVERYALYDIKLKQSTFIEFLKLNVGLYCRSMAILAIHPIIGERLTHGCKLLLC